MVIPVIMAGGSGSRLWPLSRALYPKQFLRLLNDDSMLQETLARTDNLTNEQPVIICNEEHRFIVAEQLRERGRRGQIILEPVGRNTAPAIALAALALCNQNTDALMLVLPADHVIKNQHAFEKAVLQAKGEAEKGMLVTFGIVPDSPETGYGYIKRGDRFSDFYKVEAFVEKPNIENAKIYIESGNYYWNSGMFLFKAKKYLEELEEFRPDIFELCSEAMQSIQLDMDFLRVDETAFKKCPDDSIDYAVMEKTSEAVVVPLDAGWSDVGGFAALWDVSEKDELGNLLSGDIKIIDTKNSMIVSEDKLVASVGVDDLVIINTKDSVLVAHKEKAQDIKEIVNQLKREGRNEAAIHREVYRPWGKYDSVDFSERFQVKRITVNPGAKLSVQMHHHRAEHWVVVAGTAKVTVDGKESFLTENESVYISVTSVHSLENPGKVPLELIEVQVGSYLGEDDIVRFEDQYGRTR